MIRRFRPGVARGLLISAVLLLAAISIEIRGHYLFTLQMGRIGAAGWSAR